MPTLLAIDVLLIAACAWLAIGLAGLAAPRNLHFISKILFPLGALVGVLAGLTSLRFLGAGPEVAVLAIGLPDLPFHLRLDNLAAVFVLLLGFAAAGISIFAAGYFRKGEGTAPGLMCLQYHFFLASMLMVLLADDAYAFMVAGAPATVASLWPIEGTTASLFAQHFYDALAAGQTLAQAHQAATRLMKARLPSPRDWAAMVVCGAGNQSLGAGNA
ncbi:MAG: CHAT domain-containing protein [Armatimonadetes bacterium]|nr:CHAT domain-containing protein [Armatimonadota bacterium]